MTPCQGELVEAAVHDSAADENSTAQSIGDHDPYTLRRGSRSSCQTFLSTFSEKIVCRNGQWFFVGTLEYRKRTRTLNLITKSARNGLSRGN
ncbi:Hypothetical predicted protein [Cloeon dipterum]|uniref:Uncharacterized protein n=1 Tax=Cloeon dipterum TaxID=197152 RepID=A0A8S1EE80_9INSE|nr:Hypothetical predicted protein [Cloeon dipterum]